GSAARSAGPVSAWPSPGTSSNSTAAGSGSSPRRASGRASCSPCRSLSPTDLTPRSHMDRLLVATLNILNLADRWPERLPLILADMAALQPDMLALQEVVYPMQQDRLIGAAGEGRYAAIRGWAGRPEYGNSLLVKEPLTGTSVERLELSMGRSAHRTLVVLPNGGTVLVVATHLHHAVDAAAERDAQAAAILDWLTTAPAT